jgi:hypothetical protein
LCRILLIVCVGILFDEYEGSEESELENSMINHDRDVRDDFDMYSGESLTSSNLNSSTLSTDSIGSATSAGSYNYHNNNNNNNNSNSLEDSWVFVDERVEEERIFPSGYVILGGDRSLLLLFDCVNNALTWLFVFPSLPKSFSARVLNVTVCCKLLGGHHWYVRSLFCDSCLCSFFLA